MMHDFLNIVATALVAAAVAIIAYFLKKSWESSEENMKTLREALNHCHERNDFQDMYLSEMFKQPFDSSMIAKGKMQMPPPKGKKPRGNA